MTAMIEHGECHDPRHAIPCPFPCPACQDECDPAYWKGIEKLYVRAPLQHGEEETQP